MDNILSLINYFPLQIRDKILKYRDKFNMLEEIRIKTNVNIILKIGQADIIVDYITNQDELLQILQTICDNSIYSYQSQICNGYITLKGGHRVGITGSTVIEDGKVKNITYIYSLNFRVAKEIIGYSESIIKDILKLEENTIYNTIIVSPPGRGKTTLLRDIVRQISNGIPKLGFKGINVGVVDERDEISAMYKGIPQNEIGIRTDVLSNIPKAIGMKMLIRSMNPKVIVADEIGTEDDAKAINYAVCSGVKGIFTAHGESIEDILVNPILSKLYNLNVFELLLFIDENRNIKKHICKRKEKGESSNTYNMYAV